MSLTDEKDDADQLESSKGKKLEMKLAERKYIQKDASEQKEEEKKE